MPPQFPFISQAETVNISDDMLISYAYGMCVDEKYVYVLAVVEGNWLQVYDKTDGRYVGGFIKEGQGPGELIMGYRMGWDNERKILSIYDQSLNKLLKYSVETNGDIPVFSLVEEVNFNNYSGIVREAWETTNGRYIVDGQLGEYSTNLKRYQMLLSGTVVDEYNTFPVSKPETFLQSRTAFSPSRDKMAVGILFGATLETFDLSEKIIPISVHQFYPPKLRISDQKITPEHDMIYGFASLTATDDKIYSVWVENHNPNAANSLAVFDWLGKPLARYDTDKLLFMISTAINEPEKVYALVYDNETGFSLIYIQL